MSTRKMKKKSKFCFLKNFIQVDVESRLCYLDIVGIVDYEMYIVNLYVQSLNIIRTVYKFQTIL